MRAERFARRRLRRSVSKRMRPAPRAVATGLAFPTMMHTLRHTRSLPLSVLTSLWQSGKSRRVLRNQRMNIKTASATHPSGIIDCPNDHTQIVLLREAHPAFGGNQIMHQDFVSAAPERRIYHSSLARKPGQLSFRLEQSAGKYRRIDPFYLRDQIEIETDDHDPFTELVRLD